MKRAGDSAWPFWSRFGAERRRKTWVSGVIPLCLLSACNERPQVGTPPLVDIQAATEAKPKPTAAILTDPNADARYNASIEVWGDRVRAAGVRLCRFYQRVGVKVECEDRGSVHP